MTELYIGLALGGGMVIGFPMLWKLVIKPDLSKLLASHAAAVATIVAAAPATTPAPTAPKAS